jgi:hypothetical protein
MIVPRNRSVRNRRKRGAKVLPLSRRIVPHRPDRVENRPADVSPYLRLAHGDAVLVDWRGGAERRIRVAHQVLQTSTRFG